MFTSGCDCNHPSTRVTPGAIAPPLLPARQHREEPPASSGGIGQQLGNVEGRPTVDQRLSGLRIGVKTYRLPADRVSPLNLITEVADAASANDDCGRIGSGGSHLGRRFLARRVSAAQLGSAAGCACPLPTAGTPASSRNHAPSRSRSNSSMSAKIVTRRPSRLFPKHTDKHLLRASVIPAPRRQRTPNQLGHFWGCGLPYGLKPFEQVVMTF
jgi:hypothetical protein